jgi:hypothetical protein
MKIPYSLNTLKGLGRFAFKTKKIAETRNGINLKFTDGSDDIVLYPQSRVTTEDEPSGARITCHLD